MLKKMNNQNKFLNEEVGAEIDALMAQMTLTEKLGQLSQYGSSIYSDKEKKYEDMIRQGKVGSFLTIFGAEKINRLQRIAVEESRLKIPILFGDDIIHGCRTVFPIPLAEAAAWDPALAQETARISARESTAGGLKWVFAPMLDIARDPRWGRIAEGSGEDPYLGSALGAARVRGFQGDNIADRESVLACAKHFIAYGGAVGGRDYNTVDMSMQTFFEIYYPPFKAAIEAGAGSVMSAFNDLNGVPCTANKLLITELLRERMGFEGFVVSDYNAIDELVNHGYSESREKAGKSALEAGVDMDMGSGVYLNEIEEYIKNQTIKMEGIDLAVRRILRIKFLLGLFETPYADGEREKTVMLCAEHVKVAREAAQRSIVLLKNKDHILPLDKTIGRIAVVGPLADSAFDMLGSWPGKGRGEDVTTILSGIKTAVSPFTEVTFSKGCDIKGDSKDGFEEAVEISRNADVAVVVVGEGGDMSGEAHSRSDLGLPGVQENLVKEIHKTGKPVVVILINGRPLTFPWVHKNIPAILEAWQLGVQAGNAVADVLFGDFNPSGKLPVTFPQTVGQVPIYYNAPSTGRPADENNKFTSKYIDTAVKTLYPFGFGLSYTAFAYENIQLIPDVTGMDGKIHISAEVYNSGTMAGYETVQLYVADLYAARVRPVKELKGFKKIFLQPEERKTITFTLDTSELGFYNEKLEYVVEPGLFKVWVGPDSESGLETEFRLG